MSIESEIEMIQGALNALEGGDVEKAASVLKEYAGRLSYEVC